MPLVRIPAPQAALRAVHTFGDFVPAGPEGVYQELIEASRHGQVLASASIAGFFTAAASK